MKNFLKKIYNKVADAFCGILPIIILIGIPISICIAIRWKHIPQTIGVLTELGGGSWLLGILFIIFSAAGLLCIGYAVINAIEVIWKKSGSKWAILYIIVVSLGIIALKIILEGVEL